jgi:hypothetical protein
MNRLLEGITLDYAGAPDFYAFHEQYAEPWQRGEHVPPGYHAVGTLAIDSELAAQASSEIFLRMGHPAEISNGRQVEKEVNSIFLQQFIRACETRFHEAVDQDVAQYRSRNIAYTTERITVGSYRYNNNDRWHFDNIDTLDDAVYTLTALGPTTIFATDHLSRSDFDKRTFLKTPVGLETMQYPVGTIVVHHANITAHSVPGPKNNGQARLFMNRRLHSPSNA